MRPQAKISSDAGFESDVTSNYFNENSSESEDSDEVRHNKLESIKSSIEFRKNYKLTFFS